MVLTKLFIFIFKVRYKSKFYGITITIDKIVYTGRQIILFYAIFEQKRRGVTCDDYELERSSSSYFVDFCGGNTRSQEVLLSIIFSWGENFLIHVRFVIIIYIFEKSSIRQSSLNFKIIVLDLFKRSWIPRNSMAGTKKNIFHSHTNGKGNFIIFTLIIIGVRVLNKHCLVI